MAQECPSNAFQVETTLQQQLYPRFDSHFEVWVVRATNVVRILRLKLTVTHYSYVDILAQIEIVFRSSAQRVTLFLADLGLTILISYNPSSSYLSVVKHVQSTYVVYWAGARFTYLEELQYLRSRSAPGPYYGTASPGCLDRLTRN